MIYFKKVVLSGEEAKESMEKLLRKNALRRHGALDLVSASSNVPASKMFLGNETKKALNFTRTRSSLENFLPKLIISMPKEPHLHYYRLRLSFFPSFLLVMILIMTIASTINNVAYGFYGEAISSTIPILIFYILIRAELYLTKQTIMKAAENPDPEQV